MTVQLRYYQTDVIGRARQRIGAGVKRLIIQGSTGSGKTHVACEIIRSAVAKGSRVLFLVHRRRLVQQIADRLELFGVPHGVIMAGVSTNAAPVQVASRDTLLSRSVRNEWCGFPPAELVLVDECHNLKLTGAANEDELSGYEAILKVYPNAVILGLTATPARSDGRGLGNFFQALECVVPTSQLVGEGWLVPVRCYAPERMGHARRKGKKVKGLAGDPVSWWLKLAEGRPTVAFTTKVDQSKSLVASFAEAGVPAAHIDAHTSDEERERVITGIQNGSIKVVSNVGVMVEGVDVPELSACILLRMAGSYVLYAQAIGRIMRSHPSKKDAVLIDHAGACYVHGLPDEDVEWSLDTTDTVDERNKAAKLAGKRKEPIVCPKCAFIYSASTRCPSCGHMLAKKYQPVETRDELLVEVERGIAPMRDRENRVRLWKQALAQAYHMGRSYKVARVMFKQKTGEWPGEDFPHGDFDRSEWDQKVRDLMPDYTRRKSVV